MMSTQAARAERVIGGVASWGKRMACQPSAQCNGQSSWRTSSAAWLGIERSPGCISILVVRGRMGRMNASTVGSDEMSSTGMCCVGAQEARMFGWIYFVVITNEARPQRRLGYQNRRNSRGWYRNQQGIGL